MPDIPACDRGFALATAWSQPSWAPALARRVTGPGLVLFRPRSLRIFIRMSRSLLWIDCSGGLIGGVLMLSLSGWLSRLYALPVGLLVVMGLANLAYAAFSFSLARRRIRPRALVMVLVIANASWAALCALTAVVVAGQASAFGMAHLLGECLVVGGLAALEWRSRELLLVAD